MMMHDRLSVKRGGVCNLNISYIMLCLCVYWGFEFLNILDRYLFTNFPLFTASLAVKLCNDFPVLCEELPAWMVLLTAS